MVEPNRHDQDVQKKEVADKVHELLAQNESLRSSVRDAKYQYLRKVLAGRFDELMGSRDATFGALSDPDPLVRRGAYGLVALHWKSDPSFKSVYWKAFFSDPDSCVRSVALTCLLPLYAGSKDIHLAAELARIVCDNSAHLDLRRTAYIGLFDVEGVKLTVESLDKLIRCAESLPKEVDWAFVNSFVKTNLNDDKTASGASED